LVAIIRGVGERAAGEEARSSKTLRRYAAESRTLGSSALLTAPIVLLYEAGLLWIGDRGIRNAADALIDQGLAALGRTCALAVNLFVLLAFVGLAVRSRARRATPVGLLVPVLLESGLYACLLAPALAMLSRRLLSSPVTEDLLRGLVLSLGAGFYEELVFRLLAIGGLVALLRRATGTVGGWTSAALLGVSSLAFSLFHHVGAGSEPFTTGAFVMRFVAGLLLGAIFILRGFGVVCYTHVIYDVLCMSSR
jgi:hypothetical protein